MLDDDCWRYILRLACEAAVEERMRDLRVVLPLTCWQSGRRNSLIPHTSLVEGRGLRGTHTSLLRRDHVRVQTCVDTDDVAVVFHEEEMCIVDQDPGTTEYEDHPDWSPGWFPILKWGRNVDRTYTLALSHDLRCTVTVPMVRLPTSWWWSEWEGDWATLVVVEDDERLARDDYVTAGYEVVEWM